MSEAEPSILHVDMDAFYASVEMLRDPTLRGKPVIVGGAGDRGVVASCSYEARAYGISSAMPSVRARRLCPHAVFLHGDFDAYAEYSRGIHEVFASFTPLVEGIALDEAFLDVAGARRLFGSGEAIAHAVRRRITDDLGLDCAVGVATTKLIAKLASKAAKPKATMQGKVPGPGVLVVRPGTELDFLHPLPVTALWGVGPATEERLRRLGVRTVGDLAAVPRQTLVSSIGTAHGNHLHELAWGRDPRPVEPVRPTKSIGHEETYAVDLVDADDLHREAVRMADSVATRLRKNGLAGRTVTLKVRFHDFSTITRSHTFAAAVDTAPEIARAAVALVEQIDSTPGIRLLGVSMSNLMAGAARQLTLEDAASPAWDEASRAVDAIRDKFGDRAVGPAALVEEEGLRIKRKGEQQWGPRGKRDR
ncbi:MAG TPA: DNA polymerase IV [Acidimicrobiales bacterium]|nr:DNA polymerase IV [Acidimicrobiales bacterium]